MVKFALCCQRNIRYFCTQKWNPVDTFDCLNWMRCNLRMEWDYGRTMASFLVTNINKLGSQINAAANAPQNDSEIHLHSNNFFICHFIYFETYLEKINIFCEGAIMQVYVYYFRHATTHVYNFNCRTKWIVYMLENWKFKWKCFYLFNSRSTVINMNIV